MVGVNGAMNVWVILEGIVVGGIKMVDVYVMGRVLELTKGSVILDMVIRLRRRLAKVLVLF